MKPTKTLLALSGGVDSAAAARLLLDRGEAVTGIYLILHESGRAEAEKARLAARQLGIDLILLDLESVFAEQVQQRFQDAWAAGKTPNPCVTCNRTIKFGALLDYAREAGYDSLATGHYARLQKNKDGRTLLLRGVDPAKDQSYFLAGLSQDQFSFARFPLGELTKVQVRAIAGAAELSAAKSRESQDVCFLPNGDYAAWLTDRGFAFTKGRFLAPDGTVLGCHQGAERYTLGQRRGLGIALGSRAYVTGRTDSDVIVGPEEDLFFSSVTLTDMNYLPLETLAQPAEVTAKLRYRQPPAPAVLTPTRPNTARLDFQTPQRAPAPGQLAVCYQGDVVFASGEIVGAYNP